ncbi:hypothetical protein [Secundilactobacillus odoratitofui]|uniref:hypothetical protein n=1 Tax=Secundilactobacillus odoratitofui TaxID=480930 RepID=UPI0006D275B6|nr:hypothetical protein [Secundilactobacillus odoratitofui]
MQPTLAYTIQGLQTKSPVTAFCFDQQIAYIAQTVDSATILTKCGLDAQTKTAQAASNAQITIPNLINVNSLDLLHQGQALIFIILVGSSVSKTSRPNPSQRALRLTMHLNSQIFKLANSLI